MKKKSPAPQNDIIGVILADHWDENGNVIGVSLYTDQEEIYIVAQNKRVKELIKFIQTRVEVAGKIKEASDGKKFVYVETFSLIENDF